MSPSRRKRDRDVEVEDPLREALVGVVRGDEEDHRDRERDEDEGRRCERGKRNAIRATHVSANCGSGPAYSVTTNSKVAQQTTEKSASYNTRKPR